MKKLFSLLLCAAMLSGLAVPSLAAEQQTPVIVETVYPTEDVVLADIIATQPPYSADSTGEKDATAAIQKAIDDCAANGGGTVWLPLGRYRITGSIYIRQFVTLRGEYTDPDTSDEYGTLIVADVESSDKMSPGLIKVGASAGAVGLTVWYPGQDIDNVKPYPYTFYVEGNGDYMLQTIENCTLINSYRGIGACSECENDIYQCHEMLTIENVKGTCLYEGLNSHNSADVDTIKTLYILNKYWAQAGEEFNAPTEAEIDAYTRANGHGLVLGDLEWPQFADVKISDMRYGILLKQGIRYCFSGIFTDLYVTDCDYGFYVPSGTIHHRGESWGTGITNGVIQGSECAIFDPGENTLLLTNVEVEGEIKGKGIRTYSADTSVYAPDYNRSYKKADGELYIVSADKSGKTDASATVQAVLDSAAATGGVVYLPGGLYRFDAPVTVPAGVELRGSSSVATRCQSGNSNGTLIISCYGYDKSSEPLITLGGDGAGISGIRIDYPLNNPVDASGNFLPTSPAIYGKADDLYITNCFITLASCGVMLEQADNAFIKKVIGCCYESMFSLTDCDDSFIEGCLQNGNTLPRNGYSLFDIPELSNRLPETELFNYVFIPITRIHTNYIELYSCENATVFNSFIYGGKSFLKAQDSQALIFNVGLDGSSKVEPGYILSGGEVTLVNSMRSTSDGRIGYNFYSTENGTRFRSYSSQSVNILYNEHIIYENIEFDELGESETIYGLLQTFYKIYTFFGKLFTWIDQG